MHRPKNLLFCHLFFLVARGKAKILSRQALLVKAKGKARSHEGGLAFHACILFIGYRGVFSGRSRMRKISTSQPMRKRPAVHA